MLPGEATPEQEGRSLDAGRRASVLGRSTRTAGSSPMTTGGPAVVIDPGDDAATCIAALGGRESRRSCSRTGTSTTSGRSAGAGRRRPARRSLVHAADAAASPSAAGTGGALFGFDHVAPAADRLLADGDVVDGGRRCSSRCCTRPGTRPGGICLFATDRRRMRRRTCSRATRCSRAASAGPTFPAATGARCARRSPRSSSRLPPETRRPPGARTRHDHRTRGAGQPVLAPSLTGGGSTLPRFGTLPVVVVLC